MRIALFDPYLPKFTGDMVNWWKSQGHEVKVDRYYDPELVEWADVIWFDTCDNNLTSAMNPGSAILGAKFFDNREIPWDMHEMDLSNKKVIVRPIDIEVWQGHHADARKWDIVDECIFIAPHIRDLMMADSRPQASNMNIQVIPCGVNLDNWTFRERKPGNKIAIVSEIWESKGVDYILQIALKLKFMRTDYEFHWLGKRADYQWHEAYRNDFIEHWQLPFTFYEPVESVDEWLEDKNYLLHGSIKEGFSYAIAEAMAKGIKPVPHHFYGASALWPDITWTSIDEAIEMITDEQWSPYDSEGYRQYLIDHEYTITAMMDKIMKVING